MNKAQRLSKDLEQRKLLRDRIIKNQEKVLKEFDADTAKIETRLKKVVTAQSTFDISAAMCNRILKAIVTKYKPLIEGDSMKAYKELLKLESVLLLNGLFTEEELNKGI